MKHRDDFCNLDINPRILHAVLKARLKNFVQVLTFSRTDLMRLTKLSLNDVIQLQLAIANVVGALPAVTALQMLKKECPSILQRHALSTGCNILDTFLKEGVMSGMLTEISGESAAGKTQLCLQLCLTVQLSHQWGGMDGRAVYVSTEDSFPSARLVGMAERLKDRFKEFKSLNFTDNVFVEHAIDFNDLQFCLSYKIPALISEKNLKLVVIDSVAAIVRSEHVDRDPLLDRAKKLGVLSNLLHNICSNYNIPVVLVNQVIDDFNKFPHSVTLPIGAGRNKKIPALGLAWASAMNVRIALSRTSRYITLNSVKEESGGGVKRIEVNVRLMEILSAPHLPNVSCKFIVDEDGVKGVK